MTEAEAREAVKPLGCGVHPEPIPHGELTARQEAWLEQKAEEGWPQVGSCRWVGECLVVEIQGMFGKTTHIIDANGDEL